MSIHDALTRCLWLTVIAGACLIIPAIVREADRVAGCSKQVEVCIVEVAP